MKETHWLLEYLVSGPSALGLEHENLIHLDRKVESDIRLDFLTGLNGVFGDIPVRQLLEAADSRWDVDEETGEAGILFMPSGREQAMDCAKGVLSIFDALGFRQAEVFLAPASPVVSGEIRMTSDNLRAMRAWAKEKLPCCKMVVSNLGEKARSVKFVFTLDSFSPVGRSKLSAHLEKVFDEPSCPFAIRPNKVFSQFLAAPDGPWIGMDLMHWREENLRSLAKPKATRRKPV